ncbi:MAG TPA: hypothetical protein VHB97_26260 [Polyangia bacterium]|jgi:hypothetical protein|nr:hypothetical protein [Polyangia bacterium]
MRASRRAPLWSLLLLAGCAPSVQLVRADGARALECPAASVEVRWLTDLDYAAAGCGRTAYLRCSSGRDAACRIIDALSAGVEVAAGAIPGGALVDPTPPTDAWAELSLSVVGPARTSEKLRVCTEEARADGIRLREGAAASATLYLGSDGNRVSLAAERTQHPLGQWSSTAVCRVAIASALSLHERVAVHQGADPIGCRIRGVVEGRDEGRLAEPSYEASLAALELAAMRAGADVVALDAMRQLGNTLILSGRAFACGRARPAPPPSPGEKSI